MACLCHVTVRLYISCLSWPVFAVWLYVCALVAYHGLSLSPNCTPVCWWTASAYVYLMSVWHCMNERMIKAFVCQCMSGWLSVCVCVCVCVCVFLCLGGECSYSFTVIRETQLASYGICNDAHASCIIDIGVLFYHKSHIYFTNICLNRLSSIT